MYQSLKIKSNLTRTQKIDHLQKIMVMLSTLEEEQFNLDFYQIEWDEKVGIKSNIAGWYAAWFKESGFGYRKCFHHGTVDIVQHYNGITGKQSIQMGLMKYHGISLRLVNILFFGEGFKFRTDNMLVRFEHHEVLNLEQSIDRFCRIYSLLAMYIIPLDFDYNKK